jgi:hypothetical protein
VTSIHRHLTPVQAGVSFQFTGLLHKELPAYVAEASDVHDGIGMLAFVDLQVILNWLF